MFKYWYLMLPIVASLQNQHNKACKGLFLIKISNQFFRFDLLFFCSVFRFFGFPCTPQQVGTQKRESRVKNEKNPNYAEAQRMKNEDHLLIGSIDFKHFSNTYQSLSLNCSQCADVLFAINSSLHDFTADQRLVFSTLKLPS